MAKQWAAEERGFTLVELSVTIVIISIVMVSFFGLFVSLVRSTILARRRDEALTISTNQMEYLKSLPYDSLAVQGGSIYATNLLPATKTVKVNGVTYTATTSIGYADDAYDGCGSYPNQTLKQTYCRNYPPPSGAPTTDLNPADYKLLHVGVTDTTGDNLASVDTEVAARVSETASTTGALFVTVLDGSGSPISGATVSVADTTVTPNVNIADSSDSNGVAIFYGLPPDSGNDYVISASQSGYSSLSTIAASGSLQPTYPNQKILSQQSSGVTLYLFPMSANSLALETTDTNGNSLANVKVYAKGGYKKYTATADTSYYFDNMSGGDARPVSDSAGLAAISNLVPTNGYIFCGDLGDSNCKVGNTTYYLAAAAPYSGVNSLLPITVPTYDAGNPPTTVFSYNSTNYLQKVRLMLTTSSTFPRVFTMNPYQMSLSGTSNLNSVLITLTGYNLSAATAKLVQGGNTYTGGSCNKTTTQLKCTYNLTGISTGSAQMIVTNSAGTLTLPVTPLGGFNVAS
jgi:prepilin-type N-terminal cleavage/methylation domain-containing protein